MAPPRAAAGSTAASYPQRARNRANEREPHDYLGPRLGIRLAAATAASSTTAPRRVRTASRGASARSWSGGMKRSGSGPASTLPTSTKKKPPDYQPPQRRAKGCDAHRRRQAVHHASRRRGLALGRQRLEGRSAAGALRAAGIAIRQSAVSRASEQSRGRSQGASRQSLRASLADERFPYVLTTYRLDRAPHAGGMSRHALASRRTAAGALLRDLARAGCRARRSSTATGPPSRRRAASIEARALVTPRMRPLLGGRPHRAPGRPAVSLGLLAAWSPATSPTTCSPSPRSRTSASWKPRRWSATSSRDAARADPRRSSNCARTHGAGRHDARPPHFLPTRRCASAARPARSPARNGTASPTTASTGAGTPTTTRRARALDLAPREVRRADAASRASAAMPASRLRGTSRPTSASTARTPAASKPVRPARSCAPSSAASSSSPTSATAAATASSACPFGVVERDPDDGRAFKCTFCYDRQKVGLKPACAKACPTESIQFGDSTSCASTPTSACKSCKSRGMTDAVVYDPQYTSVGGMHAFFIVRGDPSDSTTCRRIPRSPPRITRQDGPAQRSLRDFSCSVAFLHSLGVPNDERSNTASHIRAHRLSAREAAV